MRWLPKIGAPIHFTMTRSAVRAFLFANYMLLSARRREADIDAHRYRVFALGRWCVEDWPGRRNNFAKINGAR